MFEVGMIIIGIAGGCDKLACLPQGDAYDHSNWQHIIK